MGEEKKSTTPSPIGASRPSDRPSHAASIIKAAAQNVSWWKAIAVTVVTLVAAGAAAALYTEQFATRSGVDALMNHHLNEEVHPKVQKDIRDMQDRLIRIEMTQGTMKATQQTMDDKLDRLIEKATVPAWLVPPSHTQPIP
jgi:hypothetical protein